MKGKVSMHGKYRCLGDYDWTTRSGSYSAVGTDSGTRVVITSNYCDRNCCLKKFKSQQLLCLGLDLKYTFFKTHAIKCMWWNFFFINWSLIFIIILCRHVYNFKCLYLLNFRSRYSLGLRLKHKYCSLVETFSTRKKWINPLWKSMDKRSRIN